ncbi:MAG: response regulator, partial [Candidatus Anstonellales archaeon]
MARIFIVEDESIFALELQQRVIDIGHSVAGVADNGKEAIEKVLDVKPDLILMDIHLKGEIDGIQTAQQILSKYRVPIVYLTDYSDDETVSRAKITSPHGYLVKPIEDRELYISIEVSLANFEIEKKLRESERKLSITLQSIGDGVIATDVN